MISRRGKKTRWLLKKYVLLISLLASVRCYNDGDARNYKLIFYIMWPGGKSERDAYGL